MLTTKDLQRELRIGRDRAYGLMRSSGFPSIRIGCRYHVTKQALDEWLKKYQYKSFEL